MAHKHILPQIKTKTFIKEKGADLVFRYLFPDLVTCYVEDKESTMHFISKERLKELGMTREELYDIAITNLHEQENTKVGLNIIDHEDGTKALTYETLDSYDAARILLLFSPKKLGYFIKVLGDPFFVVIPCRDFLLAAPKHFENNLVAYAQQLFSERENPLTPTLLLFSKKAQTFQ